MQLYTVSLFIIKPVECFLILQAVTMNTENATHQKTKHELYEKKLWTLYEPKFNYWESTGNALGIPYFL